MKLEKTYYFLLGAILSSVITYLYETFTDSTERSQRDSIQHTKSIAHPNTTAKLNTPIPTSAQDNSRPEAREAEYREKYEQLSEQFNKLQSNYQYFLDELFSPTGASVVSLGFDENLNLTEQTFKIFNLSADQLDSINELVTKFKTESANWEIENMTIVDRSNNMIRLKIPRNTSAQESAIVDAVYNIEEIIGEEFTTALERNIKARLYNYVEDAEITIKIPPDNKKKGYYFEKYTFDYRGDVKSHVELAALSNIIPDRYRHIEEYLASSK